MKKNITESQDRRNFESVRALYVVCIRVTTLTRVTLECIRFQLITSAKFSHVHY